MEKIGKKARFRCKTIDYSGEMQCNNNVLRNDSLGYKKVNTTTKGNIQ